MNAASNNKHKESKIPQKHTRRWLSGTQRANHSTESLTGTGADKEKHTKGGLRSTHIGLAWI